MDVSQYLEIFLDETGEHLESLNTQILNLEQNPEDEATINEIFRAAHSLKGMAGTMGFKRMQNLTHDMENVFTEVRAGNMKVTSSLVDTLFQTLDALEEYTTNIRETSDEGTNDNQRLIDQLNEFLNSKGEPVPEKKEEKAGEDAGSKAPEGEAGAASSDEKFRNVPIGETEQSVLTAAIEEGKKIYGLTVYVDENCLLKAARAFLVYKAVEEKAEIILSNPTAQDIEDENFELDFSLIVISEAPLEEILEGARAVSEITKVVGAEFTAEDLEGISKEGEEKEAEEESAKKDAPKEEKKESSQETAAPAAVAAVPAQADHDKGTKNAPAKTGKSVVNRTIRVDIEKLDVLMNLVSELIIAKNSLVSATNNDGATGSEQIDYLESVTTSLHESVMKVRMVPIESVVSKFPRMIRDLQKKLGKKLELYMTGEETELDRTVVDEIGDPLMHLLRNSADHGIESAEVRAQRGKPEVGSIYLDAYQEGNTVIIEVRDDGNGIDVDAVKKKAIERGVVTPEQADSMAEKDVINLLFNAGFSTAKEITDVSGRGVGLDVVKSKIESLSGEVSVDSKYGEGSTWTIRLPLTLAIIQALMVVVGGEKYAISLASIQTIEDVAPEDIRLVENKEVMTLRGSVIPIIRLDKELDTVSTKKPDENLVVAIARKGEKLAGLVVDELIGQQEIVIKSLGKYINKTTIISGATVLGDGEIALIIDTNALI
ncbi:MAG: chemotaxis protein CheA [Lachnospiraceae bacterium]|nr:chemotaxis protein CheA [Lachnospiraceae bacterium]